MGFNGAENISIEDEEYLDINMICNNENEREESEISGFNLFDSSENDEIQLGLAGSNDLYINKINNDQERDDEFILNDDMTITDENFSDLDVNYFSNFLCLEKRRTFFREKKISKRYII